MRYALCVMYYPLPATNTRIRPYRFTARARLLVALRRACESVDSLLRRGIV